MQSNKNKTQKDFFLAGKNVSWITAMFSIVATETSVLTFISVPGIAYRGDWTFIQLAFGYLFGRIIVSIFLIPMFFKHGVTSIYEILEKKLISKIWESFCNAIIINSYGPTETTIATMFINCSSNMLNNSNDIPIGIEKYNGKILLFDNSKIVDNVVELVEKKAKFIESQNKTFTSFIYLGYDSHLLGGNTF